MKKFLIGTLFALFLTSGHTQNNPALLDNIAQIHPKHYSQKGTCLVISGLMSAVQNARDHNRPIGEVQEWLDRGLIQYGVSVEERSQWIDKVASIYQSSATSKDIRDLLNPPCMKLPD